MAGIKDSTPRSQNLRREDLEKCTSEFGGSVVSVAAFESDIKYLQKIVLLKDE